MHFLQIYAVLSILYPDKPLFLWVGVLPTSTWAQELKVQKEQQKWSMIWNLWKWEMAQLTGTQPCEQMNERTHGAALQNRVGAGEG